MHIITPPAKVPQQAMLPFREARMHAPVPTKNRRQPRSPSVMLHKAESTALLLRFQQLDLDLPLYDGTRTVFDARFEYTPGMEEQAAARSELPPLDSVPAHFDDLTIEHVAQMHAKLLYRQLEQLFYARNVMGAVRREVLEWIYQPSEVTHERRDGVETTIRAVFIPFTFEACCSFEQIDAFQLRQAITLRIEQLRGSRTLLARHTEQELQ